jgi:putative acyl-CoA dehydrogenase
MVGIGGRQIEYGTLCPATMTQASIPLLQKEPVQWETLKDKLFSDDYDPSDGLSPANA